MPGGNCADGVGEDGRARHDVLRRDVVRNVDKRRIRGDAENHTLHLRDIAVG